MLSRGDESLVRFGRRAAWHFPRDDGGGYAGHYPADSDAAVAHLHQLRRSGATHVLVPETSRWWLDHYQGLARELEDNCERVVDDESCVIFQWRPEPA